MQTFRNWLVLEGNKDIFGFESLDDRPHEEPSEKPINRFDIEYLTDYLSKHNVGNKLPSQKFVDEVRWGEGTGSLRITIQPDLHILIEKQSTDLQGKSAWISKKLFQINRKGFGGHENVVANEILEQLVLVNEMPIDSANNEFSIKDMQNLVVKMASKMRRVANRIFIFEGIRQVHEKEYIIRFSVRGQGVEAPDHHRVEENQTLVSYSDETGLIRVMNYNIESPTGGTREWAIMPSDTDIHFAPTQSIDEIIEPIATTMRWY